MLLAHYGQPFLEVHDDDNLIVLKGALPFVESDPLGLVLPAVLHEGIENLLFKNPRRTRRPFLSSPRRRDMIRGP